MAVTHLTTAMASNRGTDFVNANGGVTGTNITGTIYSNGLSLSVAAPGGPGGGVAIYGGTTSQSTGTVTFANANGVTFGLETNGSMTASVQTNYQTPGAYLTTAALSNHSHNLATTTTNGSLIVVATTNSNGATFAVPPFLTTAQAPGAYLTTARASNDAIGLNTALTANGLSVTANSSGLSINVPAWLTTAMQSASSSVFAKTGFTTATTAGTALVGTLNTNGLSMGVPAWLTTAQAPGAYLTTAAQSDHSHGNPTLALTNLTGTTASASNGFTLSLSAAAPGAGAAVTVSASNGSFTVGNLNFSNANNVTFGTSAGSIITASVAAPGGGAANTFYSTIIGAGNKWAQSSSTLPNNSLYIQPHNLQNNVSAIAVKIPIMMTNSSLASSSGAVAYTANFGIYTTNATNSTILSLHYSTSYTMYFSNSSNASRAYSVITGIGNSTSYNTVSSSSAGLNLSSNIHGARELLMPISSLLSPGAYWFAFRQSTALSGTSNSVMAMSHIIWSSQTQAGWHVATSATSAGGIAKNIGLGTYSATTGALPNGISLTQINKAATQPIFYIVNATS